MASGQAKGVKVQVPRPEDDRIRLGRVGVIAAVGFGIGVLWPWLAGVRLVPRAPIEEPERASEVASAAPSAKKPPKAAKAAPQEPEEEQRTEVQRAQVGDPLILNCYDDEGRKKKKCDAIDFDRLARARLENLASCEAAEGASKRLSIGFDLDFSKNEIRRIKSGKSTTFSDDTAEALLDCAKKEFKSVRLSDIDHELSRYSVYYFVDFIPPGTRLESDETETEPEKEASGIATVGWDTALIRDQPEDGQVKARLRYGTRVEVKARKGDWYEIEYDAHGHTGWVHKNAVGL